MSEVAFQRHYRLRWRFCFPIANPSFKPDRLSPRFGPGHVHHMCDECCLCEGVCLPIVRMTSGEIALELGILVSSLGMGPEVVPEYYAIPLGRIAGEGDMDVGDTPTRSVSPDEPEVERPIVSELRPDEVVVSRRFHGRRYCVDDQAKIVHANEDVDDGLGGQPRDRRAADMLDAPDHTCRGRSGTGVSTPTRRQKAKLDCSRRTRWVR